MTTLDVLKSLYNTVLTQQQYYINMLPGTPGQQHWFMEGQIAAYGDCLSIINNAILNDT